MSRIEINQEAISTNIVEKIVEIYRDFLRGKINNLEAKAGIKVVIGFYREYELNGGVYPDRTQTILPKGQRIVALNLIYINEVANDKYSLALSLIPQGGAYTDAVLLAPVSDYIVVDQKNIDAEDYKYAVTQRISKTEARGLVHPKKAITPKQEDITELPKNDSKDESIFNPDKVSIEEQSDRTIRTGDAHCVKVTGDAHNVKITGEDNFDVPQIISGGKIIIKGNDQTSDDNVEGKIPSDDILAANSDDGDKRVSCDCVGAIPILSTSSSSLLASSEVCGSKDCKSSSSDSSSPCGCKSSSSDSSSPSSCKCKPSSSSSSDSSSSCGCKQSSSSSCGCKSSSSDSSSSCGCKQSSSSSSSCGCKQSSSSSSSCGCKQSSSDSSSSCGCKSSSSDSSSSCGCKSSSSDSSSSCPSSSSSSSSCGCQSSSSSSDSSSCSSSSSSSSSDSSSCSSSGSSSSGSSSDSSSCSSSDSSSSGSSSSSSCGCQSSSSSSGDSSSSSCSSLSPPSCGCGQ